MRRHGNSYGLFSIILQVESCHDTRLQMGHRLSQGFRQSLLARAATAWYVEVGVGVPLIYDGWAESAAGSFSPRGVYGSL